MKLFDKSKFSTKKEMFQFIVDNKQTLIAQKKSTIKAPEYGFAYSGLVNKKFYNNKSYKADDNLNLTNGELNILAVINTTNWFDSHEDVHMPGIWDKTIQENSMIMHVQEHKSNEFEYIISDGKDLNVFVRNYTWKELGYNLPGVTQCLMFDSTIKKSRNKFMFDQYANGYVKNHSPKMSYIKFVVCINDEDFSVEYEAFNKYIKNVVNRKDVEENGYFWAIFEAKLYEGSAVPIGSNIITPTISVNEKEKNEPVIYSADTHKVLNYKYLINNLK